MPFPVPASSISHAKIIPAAAALGILLSGCALDTAGGARRPASPCGIGAVLYCEVDSHLDIESCHCARHADLRHALRSLTRR